MIDDIKGESQNASVGKLQKTVFRHMFLLLSKVHIGTRFSSPGRMTHALALFYTHYH